MSIARRMSGVLPTLFLACHVAASSQIGTVRTSTPPSPVSDQAVGAAQATTAPGKQTPVFIENKGQWDDRAKFLMRTPGMDLWITNSGVVYDLTRVERVDKNSDGNGPRIASAARPQQVPGRDAPELRVTHAPVFITYEGASAGASAVGSDKLQEYHNYYIGNDPKKWAENVPLYSNARVQGLYKGIDAVFYLDNGRPRYDLVVAPGADASNINMKVEGATNVSVTASGALSISTTLGTVEQRELFAYQEVNGAKQKVSCEFISGMNGSVRLRAGEYDRSRPLVIDPIVYSTYLGGSDADYGRGITVDGSGNAYITGRALSTNFPILNAAQGSNAGPDDAFVTKLNSSGAISYSTYLGGSSADQGNGIAVDGSANAYITGTTQSTNFPTLNAAQGSNAGGADAFVTKLSSNGAISYSTYLGGARDNQGNGIAVDESGNAYFTGQTNSMNFPTLNAAQGSNAGGYDAFASKLTSSGAISYSTYLGGSNYDIGRGIAVDGKGSAYIVGWTRSTNFPTLNAAQGSYADLDDAFLTKLTSSGAISYSTYLGGSDADYGYGIAVDGSSNTYLTGITYSKNFPILNAAQGSNADTSNAFAARLSSSGAISYSTYLGGSGHNQGNGIAIDGSGNAYITGVTYSTNFPTLNAAQGSNAGGSDAFVTMLASSGAILYSTYFGGSSYDWGNGIAVDGSGNAYITGETHSTDFPTLNAAQGSFAGGTYDAFVTKLSTSGLAVPDWDRSAEAGEAATVLALTVTPIPAQSGMLTAHLHSKMSGRIQLSLYNELGSLVRTFDPMNVEVGTIDISLDLDNLSSVDYTLVAESGANRTSSRVELVR